MYYVVKYMWNVIATPFVEVILLAVIRVSFDLYAFWF